MASRYLSDGQNEMMNLMGGLSADATDVLDFKVH